MVHIYKLSKLKFNFRGGHTFLRKIPNTKKCALGENFHISATAPLMPISNPKPLLGIQMGAFPWSSVAWKGGNEVIRQVGCHSLNFSILLTFTGTRNIFGLQKNTIIINFIWSDILPTSYIFHMQLWCRGWLGAHPSLQWKQLILWHTLSMVVSITKRA